MLARAICLRLLEHLARAAASRTFWTAGSSRPIRMAMIAITTNNSISVKPRRERVDIELLSHSETHRSYLGHIPGTTHRTPRGRAERRTGLALTGRRGKAP